RIAGTRESLELGAYPVYVASDAPGIREYLDALAAGRDDQLEGALTAEPVVLAYVHVIAALCGPAGDAIADAVRQDALDTGLCLVPRRAPILLEIVLPSRVRQHMPFRDDAVRCWAASDLAFSPIGPLLRDPPDGLNVVVEQTLRAEPYAPSIE